MANVASSREAAAVARQQLSSVAKLAGPAAKARAVGPRKKGMWTRLAIFGKHGREEEEARVLHLPER